MSHMPQAIPERQPLGDPFAGVVLRVGQAHALALETEPGADVIARGTFVVRYAVRFQGKLQQSIVPGLVVMDYGDILAGEEAWHFLLRKSHLYPRAEVVGFRSDGVDDMVFIRQLDLAQPVDVLVYADAAATLPIARVSALITPDSADIPPRLLDYLPQYPTVSAWRNKVTL